MDPAHNDLEVIRRLLADLSARVSSIERKLEVQSPGATTPRPHTTPDQKPAAPEPSQPAPVSPSTAAPVPPAITHATPTAPAPPYPLVPKAPGYTPATEANLESRIGSHWLNRIGISAVLIGITYFLKFAFDNNWIGPAGRVTIGLLAGIGVVIWSERFRAKGYQAFSYSLKAVGIGALYLSLWAAFQVYVLIPSSAAFVAMVAVTAATAAMAWAQDAQLLAAFAIAGGFVTPMLLSTGENRELALFSYVLLLDVATLALVAFKPWRRLLAMSFIGTLLLYIGWYTRFYSRSQFNLTFAFATSFFAIFAIAPLVAQQPKGEIAVRVSVLEIVAFVNAAVYFFQGYAMIEEIDRTYAAWFALALAAVYIFLSVQIGKQASAPGASQALRYLHLAVALGLITIAIPIRLDAHWITIGWFVESGVLLLVADRIKSDLLNVFALGALVLGVIRLLLFDNFYSTQLIFNMRFMTYAVAIAVLAIVAYYAAQRDDDAGHTVAAAAVIALNLLTLTAISLEIADYYNRLMATIRPAHGRWMRDYYGNAWRTIEIERDFTYSALWMIYGAILMAIGFARRSAFVRWQALVLIAATILKVFIHDVSRLDREYRIISFIVLGALLLAISFVYQRDWLQLSARRRAEEGSRARI